MLAKIAPEPVEVAKKITPASGRSNWQKRVLHGNHASATPEIARLSSLAFRTHAKREVTHFIDDLTGVARSRRNLSGTDGVEGSHQPGKD